MDDGDTATTAAWLDGDMLAFVGVLGICDALPSLSSLLICLIIPSIEEMESTANS